MRALHRVVMMMTVGLFPTSIPVASAQAIDAASVLTQAHDALGGDARTSNGATLIGTGPTGKTRGETLARIKLKIQAQLPDKYSRRDEFPAQDAGPQISGFSGDDPIQIPRP